MGTSTNGLLWYGVAIDGSPDDGDEVAEQIHTILNGNEEDEDDLYGDGREWLAEHDLGGLEFVEHCSLDYPMYGIALAGTLTSARRGYPVMVSAGHEYDPEPILAALKVLGVEVSASDIGWHLASMWA